MIYSDLMKDLVNLANLLDSKKAFAEADIIDQVIVKVSADIAFKADNKVWFKSTPTSITEFNAALSRMLTVLNEKLPGQWRISPTRLPSGPVWDERTDEAFKQFATLAAEPAAGEDFKSYAISTGKFDPTIGGVLAFYAAHVDKVEAAAKNMVARNRGVAKNFMESEDDITSGAATSNGPSLSQKDFIGSGRGYKNSGFTKEELLRMAREYFKGVDTGEPRFKKLRSWMLSKGIKPIEINKRFKFNSDEEMIDAYVFDMYGKEVPVGSASPTPDISVFE